MKQSGQSGVVAVGMISAMLLFSYFIISTLFDQERILAVTTKNDISITDYEHKYKVLSVISHNNIYAVVNDNGLVKKSSNRKC